jgi:predicted amidohydrolase
MHGVVPHLYANHVGTGDGLTFVGCSRAVTPTGVIAVEAEDELDGPVADHLIRQAEIAARSVRRFRHGIVRN